MRLNLATDYEDWRRIYFASNDDDDDGGDDGGDDNGTGGGGGGTAGGDGDTGGANFGDDDGTGGDPTGGGQDPGGGLGASDRYTGDGDDTGPTSDPTGGSQDPAGGGGGPADIGGGSQSEAAASAALGTDDRFTSRDTGGGGGGGPSGFGGTEGGGGGPDTSGGPSDAVDRGIAGPETTDRTGPQSEAAASAALGTDTRFTAGGGAAAGQAPEAGGVTTDVAGTLAGATPASTGGPGPGLGGATTQEALAGIDPNVQAALGNAPASATNPWSGGAPDFPWSGQSPAAPARSPGPQSEAAASAQLGTDPRFASPAATGDPDLDPYTNPFGGPAPGIPGDVAPNPYSGQTTRPPLETDRDPNAPPPIVGDPRVDQQIYVDPALPPGLDPRTLDPQMRLSPADTQTPYQEQEVSNPPAGFSLGSLLGITPAQARDLTSAQTPANAYVGQAAQAGEFQAPPNPANWGAPGIAAAQNMPDVSTNTTLPAWTGSAAPPGNAAAFGGYETITPSFDPNANLDPQALQAANEQPWTGAPSPAPVAGNMLGRAPNMPGSLGRSNDPTAPGLGRVIDSSGWGASVGSIQAGDYNFDPSNPNVGVNPGLNVPGDTTTPVAQNTADGWPAPPATAPADTIGPYPAAWAGGGVAPGTAAIGSLAYPTNTPSGTFPDVLPGQVLTNQTGPNPTYDAAGNPTYPVGPRGDYQGLTPQQRIDAGANQGYFDTPAPPTAENVPLPTADPRGRLPSGGFAADPNQFNPIDAQANPPTPSPAPATPERQLAGPNPPVAGPDDVGGVTPNVADQLASPGGTDGGELSYGGGGGGGGGGGFFPIANSLMQPIPKDGTPPDGTPPPDGNPPDGGVPPLFPSLGPFPNNPEEGLWAPNPGVQPGAVPPGGIPLANALNNAVDLGGG